MYCCQVVLISATLPNEILEMTSKFMTDPVKILVKRDELTLEVSICLSCKWVCKKYNTGVWWELIVFCVSITIGNQTIFRCSWKGRVEIWYSVRSLWYSYHHPSCDFLQHKTEGNTVTDHSFCRLIVDCYNEVNILCLLSISYLCLKIETFDFGKVYYLKF